MSSPKLPELPMHRPAEPAQNYRAGETGGLIFNSAFLLFALLLLLQGQFAYRELTTSIAINFLALLIEALPFMAIGSLTGGLIEVFVPAERVERFFSGHRKRSVLLAGAMGLLFPVCECAIIPVVRRLLGKGIPFSAAISFLLAGPIVNPIVAASTAIAYQYSWPHVLIRLGSGYLIAVAVGLLMGSLFNRINGLVPLAASPPLACACGCDQKSAVRPALSVRLRHALEHAGDDFLEVGKYLVIGAFLASLARSTISMETFTNLTESPWLAILLMLLLAMALNLCSEADAFIAASFQGLLPGSAQMAFMVLGPMLDLKLIIMYFCLFKKRVILALILLVFSAVFVSMLLLEHLLGGWL